MIAASTACEKGYDVTLIEKNYKLGKKLAITGKGRCNITNACEIEELIENVPTNGKFLYSAFYTFTNDDVISMFNNLGVKTKTERGKRVFPESDKAFDIEFTKFGLDGPIIKSASCRMKDTRKENYTILLDLKPALDEEKLDKRVQKDFQKYTNKKFEKALDDLLPKKLIPIIINLSEINPNTVVHQISREQRKNLVHLLKNLKFTVKRYRPIEEAIITSGGVKVNEINSSTMESKLVEGLFFAGEVIDIDAYTGGFNLQIAFSTGYLAGFNC